MREEVDVPKRFMSMDGLGWVMAIGIAFYYVGQCTAMKPRPLDRYVVTSNKNCGQARIQIPDLLRGCQHAAVALAQAETFPRPWSVGATGIRESVGRGP